MKTLSMIFTCLIFLLICCSQVNVLKPVGENATLEVDIDNSYRCELISVCNSNMIYSIEGILYKIPTSEIAHVYVHDYDLKKLKIQGSIPNLAMWSIPYFVERDLSVWLTSFAIQGLIVLSYFIEDPKVHFSPPFREKDMEALRLYCRYPRGLTEEQWTLLLQHYEQDDFGEIRALIE